MGTKQTRNHAAGQAAERPAVPRIPWQRPVLRAVAAREAKLGPSDANDDGSFTVS